MSSKSSSRVKPETIESAVNALFKWKESKSSSEKAQLLPQDEFFYLILSLKKIPNGDRTNPYKIPLSHPLLQDSLSSEICLVIDDRPKSNLTSEAAKKKVKSENIPVSKVLKLSKLKTNYKPFEAKRKLCDSYDMFFADKRVIHLLPKLLGNSFFKKHKLPLPIDLTHKNWKEQIERGCSSALLYMKSGTCCVIKVGKVSMEKGEVVENVVDAVNGVVGFVPKMWEGIRSLHLKLLDSVPLPLYQTVPDMKLKIQGIKSVVENVEEENGSEVEVKEDKKKDGKLSKKKKGRIHEVRYMDATNVSEGELGSDVDVDENDSEKVNDDDELVTKKRKKRSLAKEGNISEVSAKKVGKKTKNIGKGGRVDADDENESQNVEKDDPASEGVEVKKKKKKGGAAKGQVINMDVEKDDPVSEVVEVKKNEKKGDSKSKQVIGDKNVKKPGKKMSKKGEDEEQKKIELSVKSAGESGTKKGKKKSDPRTTRKNSDKKVKNSKK